MGTALTAAPTSPKDAGNNKQLSVVRFVRAAKEHVEPATDNTVTMTTGQQVLGPLDVPAYGYLRDLLIHVVCTTAANAAATAYKEDAPWSAIAELVLTDVNGAPIFGPVGGYDLFLAHKYGGYDFDGDPTRSPAYSLTSGAGGTGGSFSFLLRLPLEITGRDALGALPNQNAASTYKLRITVAASTDVYSTAPTTLGSVRIRTYMEAWSQPDPTDLLGRPQEQVPPQVGTTQYWSKFVANIASGAQTIRLPRVGNLLRTLIFVFRTTTPARSSTNFPDPFQVYWDGRLVYNMSQAVETHFMQERYGYTGAIVDTGVFVLDMTHDFDGHPGGELRDLYLPTTQGTRLEIVGSFGAAGTLTILTNDIAPVGDIAA